MRKTLATLALAGVLAFGGCKDKEKKEYTTIKGTVFSERYMPASVGWGSIESRYSFSLDTEKERKTFEVYELEEKLNFHPVKKESIDAMIEPGTKVEVQIEKGTENQTFYKILPERIKVIR